MSKWVKLNQVSDNTPFEVKAQDINILKSGTHKTWSEYSMIPWKETKVIKEVPCTWIGINDTNANIAVNQTVEEIKLLIEAKSE